jgi:carbon monoxide dehydrogenase subunit G
MDISGTHRFAANRQAVWEALHNSGVLTKSIPGAENVSWQGESAIAASVNVHVGPIGGKFAGQVQVVQSVPASLIKLAVNRTVVQAEATVNLADDGAGTLVSYSGNAKLSGAYAVADNPITKQMAQGALGQFFKNFEAQLG